MFKYNKKTSPIIVVNLLFQVFLKMCIYQSYLDMDINTKIFRDNFLQYYRPLCLFTLHYLKDIDDAEDTVNMFKEGVMPRFDWGVGFRAGVEIARHVQIAIGYDWGMTKTYQHNPDTKFRTFIASLTYYF